jgi:hypothetical protein
MIVPLSRRYPIELRSNQNGALKRLRMAHRAKKMCMHTLIHKKELA